MRILKFMHGVCTSSRRLDGKTAIVTGANTGIGKETARDLAQRGARVILACRNLEKAEKAKNDIINSTTNSNVVVRKVDMSSMTSVREFARDVINREKRLDILVNNAGLAGVKRRITDEGLEYTMACNHFGCFLLTNLCIDLMKQSTPSRIVIVSSVIHHIGSLDPSNLNAGSDNTLHMKNNLYTKSKLANILFTIELARRLEGTGVTVNALHPGTVISDIFTNLKPPLNTIMNAVGHIFFKNCTEGAQTPIYCAVSEEVDNKSGKYFEECKESKPSSLSQDLELAKKVWEASATLVNLQPSEMHI